MTSSFVNYVSSFWEPLASSAASKTKSPSSSPSSSSSSSHFTNPDEWRSEMISLDVARAKFMMQQESTFQKEKENLLLDVMTFTCYEATKDALLSYKKQNPTNSSSSSSETHNVNNGCNDESSSLVVVLSKLNQRAIQYYQHGQYPEAFLYFSSAMVFALDQMNRKEWEHYKHSICQMGTIQLTKRIYKHMSLEVLSLLEEEEEEYEEYHQDDDEQQQEHHHHHQHEEFHRNSDNSKEQNDEKEEDEGTNNYRQSRSSFFYNGVESIPIVDNHETKQEQLPHHRRKPKPQKSQKRQSTKDSSDNSNNSDSLMLLASMVGTLWFNMAQTHRSWGNYYQSIICYQRACLSCPLLPLVRSIRNMTALFVCAVGEIDAPQLVHKVLGPTYAKSIVLEAQEAYETLVLCNTNSNNNNNTCTTNTREETESSLGGTTTTDTTLNENERQHQHGDHPHTLLGIHKGKEEDLVGEEEEKQQTI